MNKKLTLFAFLFLFACLGYALAQSQGQFPPPQDQQLPPQEEPMVTQEPQQNTEGQNQKLTGVIQKIDLEKKKITIKDELSRTAQECDFNETSTFKKAGKSVTAAELAKGDKVSLEVDSQNIATKVEVALPESVPPPE